MPEKQLEDLLPKSTVGKLDAGKCCSICICDLEMGETIRKLACGHCFHNECVDRWFARSVLCPNCKQPVCDPPPCPSAPSAEVPA